MKKILLAIAILIIVPQALSAQVADTAINANTTVQPTVVLKNPGFVPGDFFYFADRWFEALNNFITFKEESKARIALEHAQERASEIAVVLQTKGALSNEVKNTKQDFDNNIKEASEIFRAQGREENNQDVKVSNDMLKKAYRDYHKDLKGGEDKLNGEFIDAVKKGDAGLQGELQEKIKKTKEEKELVRKEGWLEDGDEEGDNNNNESRKDDNDKNEAKQSSSEIHVAEVQIENAKRAREQFVELSKVHKAEGATDTKNTLASFDELLQKAKTALSQGDTENAIEYAKDASSVLADGRSDLNEKQTEEDFFKDDRGR